MTAYSFQRRFVEPIRSETKGGTIRSTRRSSNPLRPGGHALPGETLQLYTGMRTKLCELICYAVCMDVEPIVLNFKRDWIAIGGASRPHSMRVSTVPSLDTFARFDGFENWREMSLFWDHVTSFQGWHIRWMPMPRLQLEESRVSSGEAAEGTRHNPKVS